MKALVQKAHLKGVNYRTSFEHFDTDGSGVITQHEFQSGMEKLGFRIDTA